MLWKPSALYFTVKILLLCRKGGHSEKLETVVDNQQQVYVRTKVEPLYFQAGEGFGCFGSSVQQALLCQGALR